MNTVESLKRTPTNTALLRTDLLLKSLQSFESYQSKERPNIEDAPRLELQSFRRLVTAEKKALERIASSTCPLTEAPRKAALVEQTPREDVPESDRDARDDFERLNTLTTLGQNWDPSENQVSNSNIPYLEAVWSTALASHSVQALQKRFNTREIRKDAPKILRRPASETKSTTPGSPGDVKIDGNLKRNPAKARTARPWRHHNAFVDIVAESGELWIKVSTVTEKRILFDRAKAGLASDDDTSDDDQEWNHSGSDSQSDEEDGKKISALQDGEKISALQDGEKVSNFAGDDSHVSGRFRALDELSLPSSASSDSLHRAYNSGKGGRRTLQRLAAELSEVAQQVWANYVHPQILLVLPNIPSEKHATASTKSVLEAIRKTGTEVLCGNERNPAHNISQSSSHSLNYATVLPTSHPPLTEDVCLDCTVLLALVSDVSHNALDNDVARHPAIARQILREHARPLLPFVLYPGLRSRRLHATASAVKRMREIVSKIGTSTEQARAALLVVDETSPPQKHIEPEIILADWRKLSIHETEGLILPVSVEPDTNVDADGLPLYAAEVLAACALSPLNSAVWLFGWQRGWVTITSNRAVNRQVESCIEEILSEQQAAGKNFHRQHGEHASAGPRMWVLGTARSLIRKERGHRGFKSETRASQSLQGS